MFLSLERVSQYTNKKDGREYLSALVEIMHESIDDHICVIMCVDLEDCSSGQDWFKAVQFKNAFGRKIKQPDFFNENIVAEYVEDNFRNLLG